MLFFIRNQQSSTQQRRATPDMEKKGATSALGSTDPPNGSDPAAAAQALTKVLLHGHRGHFRARNHGPTEWLSPSCGSAGAVLLHGLAAPSALGLPAAGAQALSGPAAGAQALSGPAALLRRRSQALLHEPPQVHARGVGQVASLQMIELIVPPGSVEHNTLLHLNSRHLVQVLSGAIVQFVPGI